MKTNITVVTCNRLELTKICLASLLEKTRGEYVLSVVDNGSSDGTREYLHALADGRSNVRIHLLPRNMGVAVAANYGWSMEDSDFYLKFDNDVEVCDPLWLERLVAVCANNPNVGMAGYLLADWPCKKELIPLPGGHAFIASTLCNGGCALIPRAAHEKLGYWAEDYGKYGFEDKDYSERAALGGFMVGYAATEEPALVHLGFDPTHVDDLHEEAKKQILQNKEQGERLFVLNKLLFESGARPLRQERRFLPQDTPRGLRFITNPAYLSVMRLQQKLLDKIRYEAGKDAIAVDLAFLKEALKDL